ncbi:MAG: AraC family transcriptional regulator [Marinomonas sp.]
MENLDLEHNARFLKRYKLKITKEELENASKSARHPSALMDGMMMTEKLTSGMTFHMVDAKALHEFGFEAEFAPNFKIALLFSGDMRFQFGQKKKYMEESKKVAKVMNFSEVETCTLSARAEEHRSALYLSVEPDWFEKNGIESYEMKRKLSQHLALKDWALPNILWLQGQQLLNQHDQSYVSRMAREGFSLSLMSSWLETLDQKESAHLKPESRRMNQFKELMNSDEVLTMSLGEISNNLGMSSATLQRYAHEHLNMSLTQYLRKRRLDLAKFALHQDGVSIIEAALLAGYNHSSNFTTAFKRQFGVSPAESHRLIV